MNLLLDLPEVVLVEVLLNLSPYDINNLYSIESVSNRLVHLISLTKDKDELTVFNNVPEESHILLPNDFEEYHGPSRLIQLFEFYDAKSYTEKISRLNDSTPKFIVFNGNFGKSFRAINDHYSKDPKSSFHYIMFESVQVRYFDISIKKVVICYPGLFHFPQISYIAVDEGVEIKSVNKSRKVSFDFEANDVYIDFCLYDYPQTDDDYSQLSDSNYDLDFERDNYMNHNLINDETAQYSLKLFNQRFNNVTSISIDLSMWSRNIKNFNPHESFNITSCEFPNLKKLTIRIATGHGIIKDTSFPKLESLSIDQAITKDDECGSRLFIMENLNLPKLIKFEWISSFNTPIIGSGFHAPNLRLLRLYIEKVEREPIKDLRLQDVAIFEKNVLGLASIIPENVVIDDLLTLGALNSYGGLKNVKNFIFILRDIYGYYKKIDKYKLLNGLKFDSLINAEFRKIGVFDDFDRTINTITPMLFQSPSRSLKQLMVKFWYDKKFLDQVLRNSMGLRNLKELILDVKFCPARVVIQLNSSEFPQQVEKLLINITGATLSVNITGRFDNIKSLVINCPDEGFSNLIYITVSAPNLVQIRTHGVNLKNLELTDCSNLKTLSIDKAERVLTHGDLPSLKYLKILDTEDANEIDIKASKLTHIETPLNGKAKVQMGNISSDTEKNQSKLEESDELNAELINDSLLRYMSKEFYIYPEKILLDGSMNA
ncbi:hypothetical protein BN7_2928 [Wickerhamomyces ciferrii]|uniref:F-box domain-containing protein n=1 Tax=Wickerhamomyces ciferrii (strain ATCC 14091 / BCRC 22168 / CBS 111 / JCM 3599 / NBRC 0793 / NRRL Y-1031 F-60-10) TaxID=1206466 RepID=K0KE54_WICCF|nr:uncharacterized protein BN7_2928 [Wickerhamomyces ciferrii]CCH43380.1 hypothetical protein BN7_2928 [Wickerhamomyces ciferrii]